MRVPRCMRSISFIVHNESQWGPVLFWLQCSSKGLHFCFAEDRISYRFGTTWQIFLLNCHKQAYIFSIICVYFKFKILKVSFQISTWQITIYWLWYPIVWEFPQIYTAHFFHRKEPYYIEESPSSSLWKHTFNRHVWPSLQLCIYTHWVAIADIRVIEEEKPQSTVRIISVNTSSPREAILIICCTNPPPFTLPHVDFNIIKAVFMVAGWHSNLNSLKIKYKPWVDFLLFISLLQVHVEEQKNIKVLQCHLLVQPFHLEFSKRHWTKMKE